MKVNESQAKKKLIGVYKRCINILSTYPNNKHHVSMIKDKMNNIKIE